MRLVCFRKGWMCRVDESSCDDAVQWDGCNEVRGAAAVQGWWIDMGRVGQGQHHRISCCNAARFHMLLY